jgi:hypothetical protein
MRERQKELNRKRKRRAEILKAKRNAMKAEGTANKRK